MSALPIAVNCETIRALVVGAGVVATRKALALHEAGAFVRVVAPSVSRELAAAASDSRRLTIDQRSYAGSADIADAELVFAATDSHELNELIARDARAANRLVNVASKGADGSFVSMAVHRAGPVTIGVVAGGVPSAAMEIRDAIAARFDELFDKDIESLASDRRSAASGTR